MAGLMLCLVFNNLHSTVPRYRGIVKDDSGATVEFATVTLVTLNDSTLIDGTVTDENGMFSLTGKAVPLFLRVSAMGFEEKIIDNPTPDVGEIRLETASYMLGEVAVNGSRPVARLKGNGVEVAISGTYLANTGTALDLLGKMPFVSKSGSEIEVLGKGTPLVYINGREVRDQSELDRLASSQIKNVEVITTPGARYPSSVNSVIRITTVAPVGEGFSFNDRTTAGYKRYLYLFEQANFNYRRNGLDLFGMLNYENYRERPGFANSTTRYFNSTTVTQNSAGKDFARYPVYQGKVGLNQTVGEHYLGFYYDFSFKPSTSAGSSLSERFLDDIFSESLDNQSSSRRHNRQHLFSAYYTGKVGKWELSANFDALWQINDSRNEEEEASSINPSRNFSTINDVRNRLLAGNVIVSFPVWKGNLRFGAEVSNIHRTDRYSGDADYIADNDVKIDETTSALFAETEQTFGPVSVGMGLRWEYTDSKYWQFGRLSDDGSRKYHNLAPSASLSLPVGNVRTSLSYARKTSRPAFEQLNSAVKYIDRYLYESGNPALKPIYRDYLTASASWKDLVVELEYSSTRNYFMWQTTRYAEGSDVILLRMVNMPKFNSFGAYLNYSPTFFGCWHPALLVGIQTQDFKLNHVGQTLRLDKPMGIFRFNNALRLPFDIWLNLDFSARTAGDADNMHVGSTWQCDFGLYKSFADDTWNLKLQLNDIFDTSRMEATSYDALSRIHINKLYDTRDLSLTLRYNFNAARSRYRGHGAANTEKGRL